MMKKLLRGFSLAAVLTVALASTGDAPVANLPVPPCPDCPPPQQGVCDTVYVCICPLVFCELTGGPVCMEVTVLCD